MTTEMNLKPVVFQFSATQQEVRSFLLNQEPWFVAKDVCSILGISNSRQALSKLDDDEKLVSEVLTSGQRRKMNVVNESGLYALIIRSNKPEAKAFRKWVTSEVLPSIRKKGYYQSTQTKEGYIDARDVPYTQVLFNNVPVRTVQINKQRWFHINDIHKAINVTTESTQVSKKLNLKQKLAVKIYLFGATNPGWFTNRLGFELLLSGSKFNRTVRQLSLPLNEGGNHV